ncbi:uncharacterized protein LOC117675275 isoform X2 [Pantherophis guttatus]|uniref:Uncharacterized protein LOC117675275 isoform X2 n=1 Tax=Pantherophis guttatus TaxID=94885 RepID=A0A6P9DE28_PANGU|nr:uncharacterized protein LOC117675275 isoform X2 [Pantherophis guttatus]
MAPLWLTLAAAALAWPCPAAPSESRFSEARVARWAAAALRHVAATQCPDRGGLLPRSQCQRLVRLSQGPGPAVYISEPARPGQKVRALLPDGWGDKPSAPLVSSRNQSGGGGPQRAALAPAGQDAVLVLDPNPGANFGHPLLLFYVDFNVSPRRCRSRDRLYLGSYECLTPVQRNHCENQLKRRPGRGKGRSQRSAGHMRHEEPPVGFCEIHFLPLIVVAQDLKHLQKLHCIDLHGYSPCPQPLPLVSSSSTAAYCELNKNTRRCHRQQAPMYKLCRMYQTCDHAVLIAGGWQEQVTYPHHAQNLLLFYQMLRRNGFRQEHIKAFFANEGPASVEMGNVQPATEKLAIRSHLALICRSLHCADTLVLYLNSPASSDGTMFLWDANHNGIADPKERYTISELLTDLENCNARRVLLFLDQSYPGPLVKKLQASQRHPNVVLVHSTTALRSGSAFAEFWAGLQPDQCLLQHTLPVGSWSAVFASGTPIQLLNVTLAGAPCHSVPPLGEEERQRRYHGCQNLPTMLWYQSRHQQELQQDD